MTASSTQPIDDTSALVRSILDGPSDGTLPSLTREELFTLSDEPVLGHGGDTQWWQQLDAAGQELVMQTAQRGLVARNLLVAGGGDSDGSDGSDGGDGLDIDARVRVILRARREPSFLLVAGEPAAEVQFTGYGIDLVAGEHAAVLVSARLEGIYLNRLLTPAAAADTLAGWLVRSPADAEPAGRTIEVIHPAGSGGSGDEVSSERAIVFGDGASWVLSEIDAADGSPRAPRPSDETAVRTWISDRLRPDPARSGVTAPVATPVDA